MRTSSKINEKINNLRSHRREERIEGVKKLNEFILSRWKRNELETSLEKIIHLLTNIVLNTTCDKEHDETLKLICNLSIHFCFDFSKCAKFFLSEIIPSLHQTQERNRRRFLAVAVLISFSIEELTIQEDTLNKFIELYLNKKARGSNIFTNKILEEIIKGIILMISSFNFSDKFIQQINQVIERGSHSSNQRILSQIIDLIGVTYTLLEDKVSFTHSNQQRMQNMESQAEKKEKKKYAKELKEKIKDHIHVLNGNEAIQILTLNNQDIMFTGLKKINILKMIRFITGYHLQTVLIKNENIHQIFDYTLKSQHQMKKILKKEKSSLDKSRIASQKERDRSIETKRIMKIRAENIFD
jgi:hypothetical protein